MTTFIALLRAVNLGARNKVPMAELRKRLSAIGFAGVRTYVQSGNVVFAAGDGEAAAHAAAVNGVIARDFGIDVQVLVLTAAQMAQVAAANPFADGDAGGKAQADDADRASGDKSLHATFLFAPVERAAFDALKPPAQEGEEAELAGEASGFAGQLVYLHLPHGYGRTKLGNPWFERVLGVPATTRNWRTVLALRDLARSDG